MFSINNFQNFGLHGHNNGKKSLGNAKVEVYRFFPPRARLQTLPKQ